VGWLGQDDVGTVNVLWAVAVVAVIGLFGLAARRIRPGLDAPDARAMLAAGVAGMLLVNPNLFVQDCVLLYLALDLLDPSRRGVSRCSSPPSRSPT
jgi:hypothetical protein